MTVGTMTPEATMGFSGYSPIDTSMVFWKFTLSKPVNWFTKRAGKIRVGALNFCETAWRPERPGPSEQEG